MANSENNVEKEMILKIKCECQKRSCIFCNMKKNELFPSNNSDITNSTVYGTIDREDDSIHHCLGCENKCSKETRKNMFCEKCRSKNIIKSNKLLIRTFEETLFGSATETERLKLQEKIEELKLINNSILLTQRFDEKLYEYL